MAIRLDLKQGMPKISNLDLPNLDQRLLMYALVALLAVFNLWFLFRLSYSLVSAHAAGNPEQLQAKKLELKAMELQMAPVHGLDEKLADADKNAATFYSGRLPNAYSTMAAELGKLQQQNSGVHITRVQYSPTPASAGLTEVRMDASLSGDYQPLVRFINEMERDKLFFVIRGLTLNGQQGGVVNLRLRVDTYLRPGSADASGVPAVSSSNGDGSSSDGPKAPSEAEGR